MGMEGFDPAALLDSGPPARDVFDEEAFRPWRLKVLSRAEFDGLSRWPGEISTAQLAYLCWWNLLAPTSHNTVPQRFRFHPEEQSLTVWLDRAYVLAASDVTGRQATVSLGCGLANTVLAARCYGLEAEVEVTVTAPERLRPQVEAEPRYSQVARVRLRGSGRPPAGDEWLRAMLARKVIRAEYDDRVKLDPALVERLEQIVKAHAGLELHLLCDAPTLLFLGKFQELADSTVFNRDDFALELGAWFLENHNPSHLGMRGQEYGLSDETARRIHRGLLREQELLPDEMAGFAKAGNLGMRSSSGVAVITVQEDTPAQRLAAGQAYEEMALTLLQHRFCTAMHAGITEVEAPNLAMRGRLRTRRRPTVVFRIGRPLREEDWYRPHSSRPPLEATMLPDEA